MKHETFTWLGKRNQRIFGQSWMPDIGPLAVIILVHGLGEHSGRYQHLVEAFTEAGYAVLAFDLPGHGKSEGKRGHSSFEDVASEIEHLLEESERRYPRKPRYLYGHSLGGEIVLYTLLRCSPPIQGAVVTSPGLSPGAPVPGWKLLLAQILNKLKPDFTLANGLDRNNLSRDPQVIERYDQDPLVHDQISARLGWDLLEKGKWILENAGKLNVPVLLVQGGADQIVSPPATRRFAQAAPSTLLTYKEWDGLYHETHNEPEKQQVIQYTMNWISQQR